MSSWHAEPVRRRHGAGTANAPRGVSPTGQAALHRRMGNGAFAQLLAARPGWLRGAAVAQRQAAAPPAVTTPVPAGAQVERSGARRLAIGAITVRVLPDARSRDPRLRNRAETSLRYAWSLGAPTLRGGRVAATAQPAVSVTVRTTYGPGVGPASSSGYGRGTTAADMAAGDTSLGFHEGRHGAGYLDQMAATPPPAFAGAVGQTAAEYQAARRQFGHDLAAYFATILRDNELATDCVGTTIDQANAQQGRVTTVCVP